MDFVVILVTYGFLFLSELGDKTQLIVFNLALEYDKFYKVGIGVTLGFALIVTIGVFFGAIIAELIPIFIISIASGIIFIIIGLLETRPLKSLYLDRGKKSDEIIESDNKEKGESEDIQAPSKFAKLRQNPYLAGFGFISLMELGDKTQIATISFASTNPLIEVWIGSFLALITVAWIGILIGGSIAKKIPKFYLKLLSVLIFLTVGIITIVTSF
ncbi:MAG: TMEM165/GDT1 family protein [Candidatus Hodarchaeota archaeon]